MSVNSYRDLEVWQVAMDLTVEAYRATRSFPKDERFGLTSQVRRSVSSVAANIAEGWGRQSPGDFIRHLRIAQGSLKEFETHVILAGRLELLQTTSVDALLQPADRVGRMLRGLIRSLVDQPAA